MASGDGLATFIPQAFTPHATLYATIDLRNLHPVLDFDDTIPEYCYFTGVASGKYSGGGVTVRLHVAFTSAITGSADFTVAFERIGDEFQDLDTDGFASAQSGIVTVPTTSGLVQVTSILFSDGAEIDGLLAGESFRIEISRVANSGNDTAVGDAELLLVDLSET